MRKTIIITGSTDGIGLEATRQIMERQDVHIILHARSEARGEKILTELTAAYPKQQLDVVVGDLSDFSQVKKMAQDVLSRFPRIDVLVNNAGVGTSTPRALTVDGFDLTWQVNYLAPVLLTHLLQERLVASHSARIINVSSIGHTMCHEIHFEDINLQKGSYSKIEAYCQSKLALIIWGYDLAERLRAKGVTVNSLHPGTYVDTKIVRQGGNAPLTTLADGGKSLRQLVLSEALDTLTGKYFDQFDEAPSSRPSYDVTLRKKLMEFTNKQLKPFLGGHHE